MGAEDERQQQGPPAEANAPVISLFEHGQNDGATLLKGGVGQAFIAWSSPYIFWSAFVPPTPAPESASG